MPSDNLAIWKQVEKTDPKYVKPITGKAYKGTSPNATWLAKRATEVFGPCGIGWGVNVLAEGLLEGANGAKVHRVHIRLWYVLDGQRGEVEHFGQTDFCGKRKSGDFFTDEDAPKKSLTDAMVKAMSLLGFAGDIFLGQYDDNKYVQELREEFAGKRAQEAARAEAETYVERSIIEIGEIESTDRLKAWWNAEKRNRQLHFDRSDDPLLAQLKEAVSKRGDELAEPVREAAE